MALSVNDRLEIEELIVRYTYFLDGFSSKEEFVSLFTEDGVLVSPYSGRYVGRKAVEEFADRKLASHSYGPDRTEQMRHIVSNVLIEGDGDTATMKAFLLDFTTRLDVPKRSTDFILAGHYECDVVRVNGKWKLKSRVLIVDTITGGPYDNSGLDAFEVTDEQRLAANSTAAVAPDRFRPVKS